MADRYRKALERIRDLDHKPSCRHKMVPLFECTCLEYPDDWPEGIARKALEEEEQETEELKKTVEYLEQKIKTYKLLLRGIANQATHGEDL